MKSKNLFKGKNKQYKKIPKEEKSFNYKRVVSKNKSKIICYSFILLLYTFMIICITSFICLTYFVNKKGNLSETIETKIKILKYLTNNDKAFYEGVKNCLEKDPDEQLCLYQFICPKEVINKKRILMGNIYDGSYVLLDDFKDIKIAYSIGIGKKIQFDKALADKGIDVYMYDHTIEKLPYENEKFHWKKIGIGNNANAGRTHNIQTLTEMMKDNGHTNEKNMILKIDVEGPEWKALNDLPEEVFIQFKFIIMEFHFFKLYPENPELAYNVFKKIYKTHQAFYVHCCHLPGEKTFGNNRFCVCLEVSYAKRSEYSFTKDKSIYPIEEFTSINNKIFNVNILKLFDDYN